MNKDNNSDHKEDHKDNNSCFDEETIEVVLQLQEPLPFKTTDFIPEPFIPTLQPGNIIQKGLLSSKDRTKVF